MFKYGVRSASIVLQSKTSTRRAGGGFTHGEHRALAAGNHNSESLEID